MLIRLSEKNGRARLLAELGGDDVAYLLSLPNANGLFLSREKGPESCVHASFMCSSSGATYWPISQAACQSCEEAVFVKSGTIINVGRHEYRVDIFSDRREYRFHRIFKACAIFLSAVFPCVTIYFLISQGQGEKVVSMPSPALTRLSADVNQPAVVMRSVDPAHREEYFKELTSSIEAYDLYLQMRDGLPDGDCLDAEEAGRISKVLIHAGFLSQADALADYRRFSERDSAHE
jgi:hypothetical protein